MNICTFKQSKVKDNSAIHVISLYYADCSTSQLFITLVHKVGFPVNEFLSKG